MLKVKSAKRYATAFYELALQKKQLKKLVVDFEFVSTTINKSKELKVLLSVPMVSNIKRYELIKAIFEGKIANLSLEFIEFLIHKNRIAIIEDVADDLRILFNEYNNIQKVTIFSASKLSQNDVEKIEEKFSERLNKYIIADTKVLPNLIGGFKVQIDDLVYDFSVLSQLEQLKNNFINAG